MGMNPARLMKLTRASRINIGKKYSRVAKKVVENSAIHTSGAYFYEFRYVRRKKMNSEE